MTPLWNEAGVAMRHNIHTPLTCVVLRETVSSGPRIEVLPTARIVWSLGIPNSTS